MIDEKLALMFKLAQEQQKTVQTLISDAKEIQRQMEYQGLNVAKIAVQAVKEDAKTEVKDSFKQYETNLKDLLAKAEKANQALEVATKKLNYKLISGFAIFAFTCTLSLLGVSFWLTNTIKEQRQTIARLEAAGGNFQLSTCDGQTCIRVLEEPRYVDGYRIIIRK